jgi:hypothetical protein
MYELLCTGKGSGCEKREGYPLSHGKVCVTCSLPYEWAQRHFVHITYLDGAEKAGHLSKALEPRSIWIYVLAFNIAK